MSDLCQGMFALENTLTEIDFPQILTYTEFLRVRIKIVTHMAFCMCWEIKCYTHGNISELRNQIVTHIEFLQVRIKIVTIQITYTIINEYYCKAWLWLICSTVSPISLEITHWPHPKLTPVDAVKIFMYNCYML